LKGGTLGYIEWNFIAESGRDYTLWMRAVSVATSFPDTHDAAVLEVPACKITEPDGPWKGSEGSQRA
jgi:hypothetical protein